MPLRPPLSALALAFVLATPTLAAQSPAGPRVAATRAGVSVAAALALPVTTPVAPAANLTTPVATEATLAQPSELRRRGVPQMIIGGVALVGGAIIGDDAGTIISIGGLAYGLYGLFLFLD